MQLHKILLGILFLCVYRIDAQEMAVYSNIKVGETIPDIVLKNVDNYSATQIKLSELKQDLLILDFWATWCGPCVAMIPRMDSIMKAMPEQVLFVSVSQERKSVVTSFLEKREKELNTTFGLPNMYQDTVLNKMFPHYYLPHYVWIKLPERKVIAITSAVEISKANIKNAISNPALAKLSTKVDQFLDFKIGDRLLPFLTQNDSIRNHSFKQYSFFTSYIPDLPPGMDAQLEDSTENKRIVFKNMWGYKYFAWAFGNGRKFNTRISVKMEVKDPIKIYPQNVKGQDTTRKWLEKYGYSYELSVHPSFTEDQIFEIMRRDVSNFFHEYEVYIEPREEDCWVLVSTGDNEMLRTKGGKWIVNQDRYRYRARAGVISDFVMDMNMNVFDNGPIIVDESNIDYYVDLDIQCENFRDIDLLNKELEKYNLKLIAKRQPVDVLVIRDR